MVSEFLNKIVFTVFRSIIYIVMQVIVKPIITFVINFTVAILSYYLYQVAVALLSVVDLLSDLFRIIAGLDLNFVTESGKTVVNDSKIVFGDGLKNFFTGGNVSDAGGDLLFQLLVSEPVMETFISVSAVGVFLTFVSVGVMIIKQEFDSDKPNAKGPIIASAIKSFIYMIFVPVICIFGVFVSNLVLKLVDTATNNSDGTTISGLIFTSAAFEAGYEGNETFVSLTDPISAAITAGISAIGKSLTDKSTNTSKVTVSEGDLISDEAVMSGYTSREWDSVLDSYVKIDKHGNGPNRSIVQIIIYTAGASRTVFSFKEARKVLHNHYDSVEFDPEEKSYSNIGTYSTDSSSILYNKIKETGYNVKIFFTSKDEAMEYSVLKNTPGDPKIGVYISGTTVYRTYYNALQVAKDFNATKINYFVLIISTVIIIKALTSATVGLIMRLYKATAFFLVLPGVLGISPLDGGSTFNSWKKTFVGEVLAGYGFVIAVNIYIMLAPLVQNMNVNYDPSNYNPTAASTLGNYSILLIGGNMAEAVVKMVFMMAGALMIEKLAATISGFIGGVDLASVGKSMASEVAKTATKGAVVGGGLMIGAMSASYGGIAGAVKAGKGVKSGVKKTWDNRKNIATSIKNAPKNAVKAIANTPKAAWGGIKSGVGSLKRGWGSVKSAKGIKGKLGVVGSGLSNVTTPVAGKLGKVGFLSPRAKKAMKYAGKNYGDAVEGFNKYQGIIDDMNASNAALENFENSHDMANLSADDKKEHERLQQDFDKKLDTYKSKEQEIDAAGDKLQSEAAKFEGGAQALAHGSFKNAQAAGLAAGNLVLDSLPGGDILKGVFGQHKQAQNEVDGKGEDNKDRAEILKKYATDLKDKLSVLTPQGAIYNKASSDIMATANVSAMFEQVRNSQKLLEKEYKSFLDAIKRNQNNPDRIQSILNEAGQKGLVNNQSGRLISEKEFKSRMDVYSRVELDVKNLINNGGSHKTLKQGIENILKTYNIADNAYLYKDLKGLLEAMMDKSK